MDEEANQPTPETREVIAHHLEQSVLWSRTQGLRSMIGKIFLGVVFFAAGWETKELQQKEAQFPVKSTITGFLYFLARLYGRKVDASLRNALFYLRRNFPGQFDQELEKYRQQLRQGVEAGDPIAAQELFLLEQIISVLSIDDDLNSSAED
jgi:hypothetical protein